MLRTIHYDRGKPRRPEPLELPIRILLATREAPHPDFAFNLFALARQMFRSSRPSPPPIHPSIFALDASDAAVAEFVATPLLGSRQRARAKPAIDDIRMRGLPGEGNRRDRYDIVHVANWTFSWREPPFDFNPFGPMPLGHALRAVRCRLLIVQSHDISRWWRDDLVEWIDRPRDFSILFVAAADRRSSEGYFARLYESLARGRSLQQSADDDDPRIRAYLHLLDPTDAREQIRSAPPESDGDVRVPSGTSDPAAAAAAEPETDVRSVRLRLEQTMRLQHASRRRLLFDMVDYLRSASAIEREPVTRVWRRSGAPEPFEGRMSERLGDIETALQELEGQEGPRVLNANFSRDGKIIRANEPLRPRRGYELLVDIGPRWDKADSIVEGSAEFPAQALPPSDSGHEIDVVFASDDFAEHLVRGRLWLPDGGRSHPIVDGARAERPGPIALRLTTPRVLRARTLHGRLCLYFGNNLLQSAAVRATLAPLRAKARKPNSVAVDYVLTGSLNDVARLEHRAVRAIGGERRGAAGPAGAEPVGLNLTLNDDGGGGHRILVPSLGAPASIAYDPLAAAKVLGAARGQLLDLFWKRNPDGSFAFDGSDERVAGLDAENGKSRDDFRRDLYNLARHGSRLFSLLFNNVRPPAGRTQAQWVNDLRAALAQSTVIQIARTGPAQYSFPWSLVYDFPLQENKPLEFCPTLREWAEDTGRRDKEGGAQCPQGDHEAHDNRICPYGFWGLRHRIEQPPSLPIPDAETPPLEPRRHTGGAGEVTLQAAHTTDAALDPSLIAAHLRHLAAIKGLHFAPPPARDWDGVVELLKSPDLLYFLCHGEYDRAREEPYIGIGLRDGEARHRVYANALAQQLINGIDADLWQSKAPLIIINGCHTANLEPGQVWNFVQSFVGAGASGVIGTEVSVRLPVAVEAAEALLGGLAGNEAVADAIRAMRWSLLNKGNLLGLAYTPYCVADLRILSA